MGTWYQCVVDRDVQDEAQAQELSALILTWLVDEGIVGGTLSACVLGGNGMGYAPGRHFSKVTAGGNPDPGFLALRTNGLEIITHREMSFNMQGDFAAVRCPACDAESGQDEAWAAAVEQWLSGLSGRLLCEQCHVKSPVSEWEHVDAAGFGSLTFKFWDWPPLSQVFLDELARRLGHRIVLITGKL